LWTVFFGVYVGENPAGDLHDNLKDTKDDEYADEAYDQCGNGICPINSFHSITPF
jgi:hypothetical protein